MLVAVTCCGDCADQVVLALRLPSILRTCERNSISAGHYRHHGAKRGHGFPQADTNRNSPRRPPWKRRCTADCRSWLAGTGVPAHSCSVWLWLLTPLITTSRQEGVSSRSRKLPEQERCCIFHTSRKLVGSLQQVNLIDRIARHFLSMAIFTNCEWIWLER